MDCSVSAVQAYSGDVFSPATAEDVEKSAFIITGYLTGLAYDTELFFNQLPIDICDAACCKITGERASGYPGTRCFAMEIKGRASGLSGKILSKVKAFSGICGKPLFYRISSPELSHPVTVQLINFDGDWSCGPTRFSGVRVPYIKVKLLLFIAPQG